MTTAPSPAPAAPAQAPSPSAGGGAPGGGAPGGGPQGGPGQGQPGMQIVITTKISGPGLQAPQPTPMQRNVQGQGQDPNGQQPDQARNQQQQMQQAPKEKGFFGKLMDAAKEVYNEIKGAIKDAIGIGNGKEPAYQMSRGGPNPGQQQSAPSQSHGKSQGQSREAGSLDNLSPDARKAAVEAAMGGSKGAQHKGAASNDLKQAPSGQAQGGAKEKAQSASR